ncbi:hypothetical protein CPB83DRAFT_860346 [Crepidotus variabilis]|uniref:Uncharacterized protein n=1 Tax=Crepidotus variabilis TaxID=179855 RepID=A0A9P6E923_9AGAR|nr:hypothetical protein CPB83DRAFT_860346 [Crepidotus variabilis]
MGLLRPLNSLWRGPLLLVMGTVAVFYYVVSTLHIQYTGFNHSPGEDLRLSPTTAPDYVSAKTLEGIRVLLVTAWFPVPNPQFTAEEYDSWLPNFFGSNKNHIYLYTTPEYERYLRSFRGENLTLTIDTSFASPLDIPPLKGKDELYRRILKKDRAKSRRSVELYANRHAKPFFLYNAVSRLARRSGKKYDFAFWSDAGSFRQSNVYTEWPSLHRLHNVFSAATFLPSVLSTAPDELIFIPSSKPPHTSMKFWSEEMGPIDNDISIASFFGGMPKSLDWLVRTYYVYHDHYLSLEIFIGKNQALFNSLFFLFPERFITVWANDPDAPEHLALQRQPEERFLGQCGSESPTGKLKTSTTRNVAQFTAEPIPAFNERFYYQFWLANDEERRNMAEFWIKKASEWRWWGWWRPRDQTPCQTTRPLDIETVLKSKLGDGWRSPKKSVEVPQDIRWNI